MIAGHAKLKWSIATALAVGAITFLWIKTRSVDTPRHDAIVTSIREAASRDILLNEEVLKVRFGLIGSYDTLTRAATTMVHVAEELREPAFKITVEEQTQLAAAADRCAKVQQQKQQMVEDFNSSNAILRNSLQYLPLAIQQARVCADKAQSPEQVRASIDAILRDTLIFGLRGDLNLAATIDLEIAELEAAVTNSGHPRDLARLTTALAHVRSIVEHKSATDTLLKGILAVPMQGQLDSLFAIYNHLYTTASITADRYRLTLFAVCVTLAIYCGYAILRLGRSSAILARVNENLENRVAERTSELVAARRTAEDATRCKSEFLANMSHEIRTPMTAILGYADLMNDPAQAAPERSDCIQTIRRNATHLLSIINDILDISKIEAGKMTVERIETSALDALADVVSLLKGRALERGLAFDTEFKGQIPRSIRTDPTRLRQILMNLVGNAVKFTSTGGVKITCGLGDPTPHGEPTLRFDVTDTGIGLTDKQRESLFAAFTQADASTTRKFGGTGLGLMISKRLAQMLGGDIKVVSTLGLGSTFSVEVATGPINRSELFTPAASQPIPSVQPASSSAAKIKPLSGLHILLAEDGPDNQRLISFVLRKAGATVELAENGLIALAKVLPEAVPPPHFDIILMDMQMPELDGYGATQQLRAKGYSGPVMALTAHAMSADRQHCLDAGCDDYATKPIDRDSLIATILRLHANPPARRVAP